MRLLQKDTWRATSSISAIVSAVREDIFVNSPHDDVIANHYAWILYQSDRAKYNQVVSEYISRFGSKRYNPDGQSISGESVKKQKTIEEEIDTEELYVSDQSFWMWGGAKEDESIENLLPDADMKCSAVQGEGESVHSEASEFIDPGDCESTNGEFADLELELAEIPENESDPMFITDFYL